MKYLLAGLGSIVLLLSIGCAKIKNAFTIKPPEQIGYSLSTAQPEDIPIPDNFTHKPDESIYYTDGEIRTASIKYVATSFVRTDDVLKFYERNMPACGWEKVADASAGTKKLSVFVKNPKKEETCEVVVDRSNPDEAVLTIRLSHK